MLDKLGSCILIIAALMLVLQEQFLIEKIPYTFFYSCKILLKTLTTRAAYGEGRSFKDIAHLLILVFGKKTIIDLFYYQIHWQKYLKYLVILVCIECILYLFAKRGQRSKSIMAIEPLKTFLAICSGISDSISLENLLWRNQLSSWHLPVVFLSIILDPLIYSVSTWYFQSLRREKLYSVCKRGFIFGSLLTLAHFVCSRDKYTTLINLRRKIPFNTSNIMTFSVGIRLLNCMAYIMLLTFEFVMSSIPEPPPVMIKDNYVKPKQTWNVPDESTMSTVASLDDLSQEPYLMVQKVKSD